jgi:putative ABC transport system substrate-binding protein
VAAVPRAQQSAMPVIGYLGIFAQRSAPDRGQTAFLKGLRETGYVDGQNLSIEYRWTGGPNDPLTALPIAKDLVDRRVSLIVAATVPLAVAVKNLTS